MRLKALRLRFLRSLGFLKRLRLLETLSFWRYSCFWRDSDSAEIRELCINLKGAGLKLNLPDGSKGISAEASCD